MADQTWDDFLLALADDFIAPSLKANLDRRAKVEPAVSGSDMKSESAEWRKRRARSTGGVKVWVHESDVDVAKGGEQVPNEAKAGPYLKHLEAWRTLFGLLFTGGTKVVPILEVSSFNDGTMLPVPGKPVVIHLPGHTAGSCAIFLEDGGAVFTGDSLVMRNPLTGRKGPQIMPSALNQRSQTALQSLSKIESLSAALVLPGHGEPWNEGVTAAVRAARAAGRS